MCATVNMLCKSSYCSYRSFRPEAKNSLGRTFDVPDNIPITEVGLNK